MAASSAPSFLAGPLPRVIAHRGLAVDAPENSALAFLKAMAAGASHLETDVHASLDGVAIISHDSTLTRTAGRDIRVEQLRARELERIPLGEGQNVLSLREALDAFPDARFNIDIKSDSAVAPTARAILETASTDRVLLTSFSEARRLRAVEQVPGVASSASSRLVLRAILRQSMGRSPVAALRDVQAVQVPERHKGVRIVSKRFIESLHSGGIEVHVWVVNEPSEMHRLLDMGADGLVTDRADLAVAVIAARS